MNTSVCLCEHLDFFSPPLINLATIQSLPFTYCFFLTLIYNTPPWPNLVCLVKNSLQKSSGKKGRRKEYITCFAYVAPIASLKTLHEKTQWEKTHQAKKSTTVDVASVLRDRPMIFGITIMGFSFRVGLPLNPATLLVVSCQFHEHTYEN